MRLNTRSHKKLFSGYAFLFFILWSLAYAPSVLADKEISYDPYISILKYPEAAKPEVAERRGRNQLLARILEQPLRPFGYGMGRSAQWVEENHMDKKVIWLANELSSHGIHPQLKFPTEGSFGAVGLASEIEFEKLFKFEQPYASLSVSGGWTPNQNFAGSTVNAGGEYQIKVPKTPVHHEGSVGYFRSSSESFYGVGQETSLGEQSTYQPEELKIKSGMGYAFSQAIEGTASFVLQRMNIGNGNRERTGKIKEHFPAFAVPGINGADLIGLDSFLKHDNRDNPNDPKRGGYETAGFSYFHGIDGKGFHYLKMKGEVAHYFPIVSDRRVFAVRLTAEKNQELNGGKIPFFNMSRLGGADRSNGSELLRSYRYNRFFEESLALANAEYRYNVYEYGDFVGDVVALFDVGEVFEELGDFEFDELKYSYGGGFNIKFRRRTFLSVTVARGNEGWRVNAHSKVPF